MNENVAHYKILEKIGTGGMGVVYRARDTRLEREVALKFLTMDFTGPKELKQRFILEAQSASVLDHPNICTIHAIEETEDGRLFIVMAYYPGETIKEKLREGPLPWQEVVDLGAQIASGLGAAHERGIIHMDVKPANLLVTPEGTVKILDFGLSRFISEMDPVGPERPLMGTVAYMSPEQVQCDTTGPESDIWALGVVLYELVTGERPFQGKNDMAVLYSIANKDVDPPIDKAPEMPAGFDKIIRRTLVRDRRYRYCNIAELMTDLEPLQQSTHTVTLPWISQEDWKRQRFQQRVTGLLAVLAVFLLALWLRPTDPPSAAAGIVFLDFRNSSPGAGPGWLDLALSEYFTIELPAEASFRWIREDDSGTDGGPRPNWRDLNQSFQKGQGLSDESLADLRRNQNAAWILRGGYETVEQEGDTRLRARLWIQDVRNGSPVEKIELTDDFDQPARVVTDLARALAEKLDLPPPEQPVSLSPVRAEAKELLSKAVQKQRLLEVHEVKELLARAIEPESDNPLILIHLANAEWQLGHEESARQKAGNAVQTSGQLPPMLQLYIRALKLQIEYRDEKAAALLRLVQDSGEVFGIDNPPIDSFNFTIRLTGLLTELGENGRALEILGTLGARHPEHPRIILAQGVATGSNVDAQKLFARAAALALQQDAPFLQAKALHKEGQAWQWLNDGPQALKKLDDALEILSGDEILSGEGYGHWRALILVIKGNLCWAQGDLGAARDWYVRAADLHASVGSTYWETRALANQALVLDEQGDFVAAIAVYRDVLERFRQFGDQAAQGLTLNNLAVALTNNGEFDQAEEVFKSSLEFGSVGEEVLVASTRSSFGKLLIRQGRLDEAAQQLNLARTIQEKANEAVEMAATFGFLGEVFYYQGKLSKALTHYENALDILKDDSANRMKYGEVRALIGQVRIDQDRLEDARGDILDALEILDTSTDPHPACRTRLILATLLIEEGRPREAEEQAKEVLTELKQSQVMLDKASARIVLARSYLAQKSLDKAQAEIKQARDLAGNIESPLFKIPLELTQARILTVRGGADGGAAYNSLQTLLGTMTTDKLDGLKLEVRFALAEDQVSSRAGRKRLEELAEDASKKGFHRIARKAREAAAAAEP